VFYPLSRSNKRTLLKFEPTCCFGVWYQRTQTYYTYVLSVLNYNSEVWGFNNADSIEKVHKKFCKSVLKVKSSTNYFAIYGELARFPLIIEKHIQIVKYIFEVTPDKKRKLY